MHNDQHYEVLHLLWKLLKHYFPSLPRMYSDLRAFRPSWPYLLIFFIPAPLPLSHAVYYPTVMRSCTNTTAARMRIGHFSPNATHYIATAVGSFEQDSRRIPARSYPSFWILVRSVHKTSPQCNLKSHLRCFIPRILWLQYVVLPIFFRPKRSFVYEQSYNPLLWLSTVLQLTYFCNSFEK